MWLLRFSAKTAVGWMSTRLGSLPVLESQMPMGGQSTSKLASLRFLTDCGSWLTGLQNMPAQMSVWNPQANTGYLYLTFLNRPVGSH